MIFRNALDITDVVRGLAAELDHHRRPARRAVAIPARPRWWLQVTRKAIAASYLIHHGGPGSPDGKQTRLVHASCHRGLKARQRKEPVALSS